MGFKEARGGDYGAFVGEARRRRLWSSKRSFKVSARRLRRFSSPHIHLAIREGNKVQTTFTPPPRYGLGIKPTGGAFATLNRRLPGATHDKTALPIGKAFRFSCIHWRRPKRRKIT